MLDTVLNYVRRHALLRAGDRVGVAVSGGADSVALLRLLLEAREQLGIVVSVVHFNHKIRGAEADADEVFVGDLARQFDLEFHSASDDTPAYAREHKLSLETAGGELRYQFFWKLVTNSIIDCVVTAHTRDDQAETVLMRFLRGAGTRGIAAIYPELRLGKMYSRQQVERRQMPVGDRPWVIRPLLEVTRAELCKYLESLDQPWREDATNRDISYVRNRVRHELLPLLRRDYNPALDQVLAETAEIARAEEQYWAERVASVLPQMVTESTNEPSPILVSSLLDQPLAVQRRLLRHLAETAGLRLDFHHVEQILGFVGLPPAKSERMLELPHDWQAVRRDRELWFRRRCQSTEGHGYTVALRVPGQVKVPGRTIRAAIVSGEQPERATVDLPHAGEGARATKALLDPALAKAGLAVRNWHPGDRYQPAHTHAPKKLKELLQAPHIPRAQKPFWPVVVSGSEIIWVPGFAAPECFQSPDPHAPALLLEEVPLQLDGKKGP